MLTLLTSIELLFGNEKMLVKWYMGLRAVSVRGEMQ